MGPEVLQPGAMPDEQRSQWDAAYALAMMNPEDFAYPSVELTTRTVQVVAASDRGRSLAQADAGLTKAGVRLTSKNAGVSVAELERLADGVTRLTELGLADTGLIWMTEPDQLNNRIVVTIAEADPGVLKTLAARFGTTRLAVRIAPEPLVGPGNRQDDYPDFFGGARINAPIGGCTTGFSWTASIDKSMVFAGHCALAGGNVSYPSFTNIGHVDSATEENWSKTVGTTKIGTQTSYRGDVALIRFFTEKAKERVYTGGINSAINNLVLSYGPWSVRDDQICANGASDGENCGKVVAVGINIHYNVQGPAVDGDNVWLRNAVRAEPTNWNQCPIPGDSGAPVYKRWNNETIARGIYSGTGGDILAGCNFFFTDIMDAYLALPGSPQTN